MLQTATVASDTLELLRSRCFTVRVLSEEQALACRLVTVKARTLICLVQNLWMGYVFRACLLINMVLSLMS